MNDGACQLDAKFLLSPFDFSLFVFFFYLVVNFAFNDALVCARCARVPLAHQPVFTLAHCRLLVGLCHLRAIRKETTKSSKFLWFKFKRRLSAYFLRHRISNNNNNYCRVYVNANDPHWHETTRNLNSRELVFWALLGAPFKVVNYCRSLWRWNLNIFLLVSPKHDSIHLSVAWSHVYLGGLE